MLIKNHLSVISICLSLAVLIAKLYIDINIYQLVSTACDLAPSVLSGGIKSTLSLLFLPILAALLSAGIGYYRKNRFRLVAIGLNLIAIIYTFLPLGMILALDSLEA